MFLFEFRLAHRDSARIVGGLVEHIPLGYPVPASTTSMTSVVLQF